MERDDAVGRLRGAMARNETGGSLHPRKVGLAAHAAFSRPDGQLVLTYLEQLTLRTVHPPGTASDVLQYREGMRGAIILIHDLIRQGEIENAKPAPQST